MGEVQIDKVYATTGAAVSLDCSKVAVNGSSWSRLQNLDNNISFTVYTDGITINPLIRNRERIRIIYNQSRGIYQLEILKVSETDEGKYRCSYLIDKDVHDYDVSLKITSTFIYFFIIYNQILLSTMTMLMVCHHFVL